ncbi:hypothetical protein [Streptomyces sp. NPDC001020]
MPIGALLMVGVTALIPALRAGRMPAVRSLVVGRAPKAKRGQATQRLANRLPLPRGDVAGAGPAVRQAGPDRAGRRAVVSDLLASQMGIHAGDTITVVQDTK